MNRLEQYKNLEKALLLKSKEVRENVVFLSDDDFKNDKLSAKGYENIKKQSEYIPFREKIEIVVPYKYVSEFKLTIESMGARELLCIKKDRHRNTMVSMILLFFGMVWIATSLLVDNKFNIKIVKEIIVIASWVFIWAGVEKWFFERRALNEKRFSLLQILSAEIIVKE